MSNTASAATGESPVQRCREQWLLIVQAPEALLALLVAGQFWQFRGGVTGTESARALSWQPALSPTRDPRRVKIVAVVAPCTTQTRQHHHLCY